jgi:hypothetical protein
LSFSLGGLIALIYRRFTSIASQARRGGTRVTQSQAALVDAQDTGAGHGVTVCVAGQVVNDAVGLVQAVFGIDHPVLRHQPLEHLVDLAGVGDPRELTRLGTLTRRDDQGTPEVGRERPHW